MVAQLRTLQSNLTGGEIAPSMYTRSDTAKYQTGAKELTNFLIRPQGGVRMRGGFKFVNAIVDPAVRNVQLPFDIGPGESYLLDFGHLTLRFIRNGHAVLQASSLRSLSNVSGAADAVFTTSAAHGRVVGDRVVLAGLGPDLDGQLCRIASVPTTTTMTLRYSNGLPVNRATLAALVGVGTITAEYVLTTPYTAADLAGNIGFAQEQAQMYLLSWSHAPRRLVRIAPDNWTLTLEAFLPSISQPTDILATILVGTGTTTYNYRVSSIDEQTGEESLAAVGSSVDNDLSIAGNKNNVAWTAATGARRYVVYREDNGVFGYIGGTEALTFIDENITPDLSDTPQQGRNPFLDAGNYPRIGTFFEQRLVFANTQNNPAGVWASQTANPRNFGVSSPAKPNDAITFRVRANRVTQIEALVPTEKLLLLTRSGEWLCDGSDLEGSLTPTNIVLRQRAFRGSTSVPPVLVGSVVVHIQRGGDAVRDLNMRQDVVSTELSLIAKHILRNRSVVDMAYQQKPDSVVWVVTNDGRLAALTYLLEHEIWGWTQMDTAGGFVEGVTVLEEGGDTGGEDVLYIQVRRTIGGQQLRYIERLSNREAATILEAYHVDSGAEYYSAEGANLVVGLHHLEGRTVVALCDGNVASDLTVANGQVALPYEAKTIAIGLPYTARLRTLDLDIGAVKGFGSMIDRNKTITEITLRVEDSRGVFAGHGGALELVEFRQRTTEAWDEAIALFSGDVDITPYADWTTTGELVVEQRDPLPLNINGILLTWEFAE